MSAEQLVDKLHIANFEPNAILRGAQLTFVGANRALQNPKLFTSDHYRQAALAVAAGIAIRVLIYIPIIGIQVLVWAIGLFTDLSHATWDDELISGLHFVEHSVLQVPFFLMSLMRYITPTLDNMFMESLDWVDRTYTAKHKTENPKDLRAMYYPNLKQYPKSSKDPSAHKDKSDAIAVFLTRSARRAGISMAVYGASHLPYIGPVVLPAASFYTFNKAVGLQPAAVIFGLGLLLPRHYMVTFLQSYFSSRSLMRQLLAPYFSRIHFTKEQKKRWFRDREGVLFGFALGFFTLIKIPLVGVLVYGIAEASTAYLVTKITDPPPPPPSTSSTDKAGMVTGGKAEDFAESQVKWRNKHDFLSMPIGALDAIHDIKEKNIRHSHGDLPEKKFS